MFSARNRGNLLSLLGDEEKEGGGRAEEMLQSSTAVQSLPARFARLPPPTFSAERRVASLGEQQKMYCISRRGGERARVERCWFREVEGLAEAAKHPI